ncbi:hypothetical protein BGZ52_002747 [Haplosporangium bisporale]|nr:hypothetical protein BGZ52_002747 [Haplosporangium bisporale]
MPTNTSQATNIFGSVPLSVVSRDPNPVLSNDDLLNMASIDELLSSCGYAEPMDTSMMMSPTITDQSLNSSPMSSLVDFSNNSRGTSPAATSFSPMAIGQSIEAFLAQPIYPITQQVSQSSQQGLFSTTTTTPVSVSAPSNPYVILAEDFSAPFSYITAGGVDSTGAPTAWPSLFPEPTSAPQRTEIATQTDGPYSPATSPAPKPITAAAIQSTLGLTDEELDPDWLNFLDEASPLFTDAELPPSPPHSGDEDMAPPRTEQSSNQRATPKNWADQLLKPDISTPPSGHRGFPSSGALGGVGQLGSGGLIRTLQGTNQQKYNKPSSTKSPSEGATSSEKSANAPTATISPSSSSNTEDASHQDDSSSAFGDLMAMIRNLWTKKE